MRLRPFGIGQEAAVLVFAAMDGAPAPQAEAELDRFLADSNVGALVATRERLLCAVVDARDDVDPIALAGRAREVIAEDPASLRAAASRAAPVGALRRTFHEARCALEAAALANGSAPPVASYRDLVHCVTSPALVPGAQARTRSGRARSTGRARSAAPPA